MVLSERPCGRTNQMTGPIDMLLQTVALAIASALVAGYWPVRWAARQPVVKGLREEKRSGWSSVLTDPPR